MVVSHGVAVIAVCEDDQVRKVGMPQWTPEDSGGGGGTMAPLTREYHQEKLLEYVSRHEARAVEPPAKPPAVAPPPTSPVRTNETDEGTAVGGPATRLRARQVRAERRCAA